jgi:hypothetical protein
MSSREEALTFFTINQFKIKNRSTGHIKIGDVTFNQAFKCANDLCESFDSYHPGAEIKEKFRRDLNIELR